ncbi:MAG: hypothetical protein V4471_04520, partial [Pseudomonadota bacterium]
MRQKAYVFDTFQYIQELTTVGFQQKQAEVQVKLMAELVNQTLCTREDLERSEERLTQRIYGIEVKVGTVEKGLEVKIGTVEKNLEVKIGTVEK